MFVAKNIPKRALGHLHIKGGENTNTLIALHAIGMH